MLSIFLLFIFMNGQPQEVDSFMTKDGCEHARRQVVTMLAEARQQSDKVPAGLSIAEKCQEVKVKLEVK